MNVQTLKTDPARQRAEERARALSDAVVQAFTEKLKSEIDKHGGFLGHRHIDAIEASFHAQANKLSALFAQAFEDAAREQEEQRWFSMKRPAFDRLIVKRFEHLLITHGPQGQLRGAVSRRILPGFFLALSMMLGAEAMEEYQTRSDNAVARVMKGQLPIDWDLVDRDADIHDVILDAQYAVAQHFENIQRRFTWFIQIANAHMSPATDSHGDEATWELSHHSLHLLINALLSDLKKAVDDDLAWRHLAERHSDADRKHLKLILERLE